MSDTKKQIIGKKGEDLACKYLEKQGYLIRDRNYLKKWGEIDIVAEKGNDLRFVEVKTVTRETLRVKDTDYEPEDNIHPWKLKRLGRAIETYLLENKISDDVDWQLDAISVYLDGAGELLDVEVLEDIW